MFGCVNLKVLVLLMLSSSFEAFVIKSVLPSSMKARVVVRDTLIDLVAKRYLRIQTKLSEGAGGNNSLIRRGHIHLIRWEVFAEMSYGFDVVEVQKVQ